MRRICIRFNAGMYDYRIFDSIEEAETFAIRENFYCFMLEPID